ncbi:hypothetical protein KKA53_01995 [Candidatus Dependentiae bacterium]|nr:hypothetical protein [Candidatus Dependentiae bacterium]
MITLFFFLPFSFLPSYNAHKAYQQNEFLKAQEILESEQVEKPNDPLINYNLGATYYKQKKYDLSKKNFERAATHKSLAEKSQFNLGNCFYKNTLDLLPETWEHKQLDPQITQRAIKEVKLSIEHYKSSLSINKSKQAQTNKRAAEKLLTKLNKKQNQENKQDKQKKQEQERNQDNKQKRQEKKSKPNKQNKKESLEKSMEKRRTQVLLKKLQEQEKKLQKQLLKKKVNTNAKPKNSYQKPW